MECPKALKKQVKVKIFGQERIIGDFDKSVSTDVITVVERQRRLVLKKGRTIKLADDRMKMVEDALIIWVTITGHRAGCDEIKNHFSSIR